MTNLRPTYSSAFGLLTAAAAPDDQFVWTGDISLEHPLFSGQIPVCLITKDEQLSPAMIGFAEQIVAHAGAYIEKSLRFIQQTLVNDPEAYGITTEEQTWLPVAISEFPLEFPQITFFESEEWMMLFAAGRFRICDPFGIAVSYRGTVPVSVDNLEDSESI
ncbi:hypothetical protein [Chitinophaga qingshengii]|uniref:DUF2262 domain-containing protein n=1 Tax=Chitinophaga qingshengii TaxID=1569794 RepID=A0ABR7TTD4_9BACT|nr:hypothetical protein [Chitinophaga qingshengii]MBC9932229.1 hypothetical protein [Chitinophaga qingshengii]